MKQILIILTLLTPLLAFGQYPVSPTTKVDLGRQTTGDGLTFRTAGVPSWTPTGKNNAWVALDTVANVLYLYDASAAEWLPVSSERTLYPVVKNVSAGTLAAGTVVAVDETDPATGDKLNVVAAEGDGTKPAKLIVGVLVQSLAASAEGRAAWFGVVKGLSLPALQPAGETWVEGDILYLSGSVNGGLTKNEPARPALDVAVAVITRISGNNLTLLVRPMLGEKLGELHDVSIAGVTNGQVLTYNDTTGLWVARTRIAVTDGDKGDITVSNSGQTYTIDNDAVTAAKIAAGAVGESELASDAVTAAKIATAAVGADEIATGAVGSDELAATSVTNAKLAADAVTTDKIAAGAVQESDIGSGAVTATKIGTGAVGATQLASTTVAAGNYTAANITVDEDGRLTSAASNTSVVTGSGANGQVSFWTGAQTQGGSNNLFWDNANSRLGVGVNTPTTPLHIRGTGTTSSTSSVLVQNSTPATTFQVTDNGVIRALNGFYVGTNSLNVAAIRTNGGSETGTGIRIASGLFPSVAETDIVFSNGQGPATNTSGGRALLRLSETFAPTSGNGTYDFFIIDGTINQIGLASGATRGIRINPVLTSATSWRSIEWSNNSGWGLYGVGTANNYLAGNTTIGTLTTPTTSLFINTTDAIRVPTGTNGQRPGTAAQGFLRYNTNTMELDIHDGTNWRRVVDIADATPNSEDIVSWTGSAFSAVASRRGIVTGTPDGSGDLTVTLSGAAAMPDATYSATATAEGTTAYIITVHSKATGSVKFRVFNDAGVAVTSGTITVNYQITDY